MMALFSAQTPATEHLGHVRCEVARTFKDLAVLTIDRLAVGPQLGHVGALNLCEHGRQVDPGLQGHAVDDVDEVRQRVSSLDGVTSTVVDGHGAVIARLGLGAGRLPIDGANELDELLEEY